MVCFSSNFAARDKASIATAIKYSGDSVISLGTLIAHGKMVIKIEEEDFVTFRFARRNDETSTKGMIDVRVKTQDTADEFDLSCTLYDIAKKAIETGKEVNAQVFQFTNEEIVAYTAKRKQMRFSVGTAKVKLNKEQCRLVTAHEVIRVYCQPFLDTTIMIFVSLIDIDTVGMATIEL